MTGWTDVIHKCEPIEIAFTCRLDDAVIFATAHWASKHARPKSVIVLLLHLSFCGQSLS